MEIRLHLPGHSLDHDIDLAGKAAAVAIRHQHGLLAAASLPQHTANQCDREGCKFLDTIVDIAGVTWLVYDCEGVTKMYLA